MWTFQGFVSATMVILKLVMCFRICVLSSFSAVSFLVKMLCVFNFSSCHVFQKCVPSFCVCVVPVCPPCVISTAWRWQPEDGDGTHQSAQIQILSYSKLYVSKKVSCTHAPTHDSYIERFDYKFCRPVWVWFNLVLIFISL